MAVLASALEFDSGVFLGVKAYSGGLVAASASVPVELFGIEETAAVSAEQVGGAFLFSSCPFVRMAGNRLSDISVSSGDGGLIQFNAFRRPIFEFASNTLSSVSAERGAGAIVFIQSAPNAFLPLDPIDDPAFGNVYVNQTLNGPPSLYGPLMATGVSALRASQSTVSATAGALLSTPATPLRITALDAYQQSITQDRNLVVQIAGPVEFRGTTLRRIEAVDGSALFSDLRVIAEPGAYTLTFSIVTAPQVSIALNLTVTGDCPSASFYSSSDRSCITCGSDVLVYNATANTCQRCPAGWQRVAANDTSGALHDGVSCSICPLGQVSSAGGLCAPCGPNTYQPTPLSECVQCSSVDGLSCVGDGLAQVQSGYFALAVGSGRQQRIQTYQCPETFCSAAEVQVATASGNSSALASASAVNSFSQCAFPRLASPTNLLCGECAESYRPWGNKCAQCDSVDGGLLFGLGVLSLALLGWLIRSSLGSPSAGHAVVVLYFAQTAMLELGSLNSLLSWLNIVLLSPNSVGRCVAPLSPYQQVQAQILMPVALWIELMVIAFIHFLAFRQWGAVWQSAVDANASLGSRLHAFALRFISQFSIDVYISATLSLLLFTYTQVAVACVSYLRCVDVGGESVVFSQPAMRCGSEEYARTKVLVVIALSVYVSGLPVCIAAFLWRRSASVREAHSALVELNREARVAVVSASAATSAPSSSDAVPSATGTASRFLRRYAPLFAMYSSSAWFWQVFVLCRRTVFVTVSVLLLPTPRHRFLAFALSTLGSLLLQLFFRPFRVPFYNHAETASHLLLLILSMTLAAQDFPYSRGVDAFIFLLVIPPLALYILYSAGHTIRQARGDTDRLREVTLRAQLEKEDELAVATHHVELQTMQANPAVDAVADDAPLHASSGPVSDDEKQRAAL